MFITIEALRNSPAMQSRVTQVETYLKKTYGKGLWDPKALFPAAIVFVSNGQPDYNWVMDAMKPVTEAYGGVDPANYLKDKANYPIDAPVLRSKADASKFVECLLQKAKALNEPLLQDPHATVTTRTEAKPVSKAKQTKAAINAKAPVKPALMSAPTKKLATDRDFPQHLASMRTRAQLDNALQAFLTNKMVKVLRPLTGAETKAVDVEVPKGKQAYVVVF